MNNGLADLHVHTTQSDGSHSPEEVVVLANSRNLAAIAITDHDEVGAVPRAVAKGAELGIEVIVGVELSVIHSGFDVHILGYFIDENDGRLLRFLKKLCDERERRIHRILGKLESLGMPLHFAQVMRLAGDGCIGRPHVAEALVARGYVGRYQDAFDLFLAEDKPAFEPKFKLMAHEAIRIIHEAGGVASLAHPGQNLSWEVVVEIVAAGVDAIEIVHPKHTREQRERFRQLALGSGLLTTGGSDFHGGKRGVERLGQFTVTQEQVEQLREKARQWH